MHFMMLPVDPTSLLLEWGVEGDSNAIQLKQSAVYTSVFGVLLRHCHLILVFSAVKRPNPAFSQRKLFHDRLYNVSDTWTGLQPQHPFAKDLQLMFPM